MPGDRLTQRTGPATTEELALHPPMPTRILGNSGIEVSAVGLGCLGMSMWYRGDDTESERVLLRAIDLGIILFDTADAYGPRKNEELLGRVLRGHRDKVVLSTKFGFIFDDDGNRVGIDGSPAYMRKAIEASLRRLQTDYVDVYFLHRVDPDVPVEESVGAMSELVTEGKVRAIGLSEAGPESLRRAHEVHPISVMENEYSLWTRAAEDIQPMLRERGIALVAYSPLGRGFLAGRIRSPDDLAVSDIRRTRFPRFDQQNLAKNVIWLERLEAIAREKNCTLSQLALAWVLSKGPDVIPIPGTKRIKYLEENAAAVHLDLGPDDLALLEHVVDAKAVAGDQKDASGMRAMGH